MEQLICHGCFYKNADGTNKIIAAGEACPVPTDECFWKDLCNVRHGGKDKVTSKKWIEGYT